MTLVSLPTLSFAPRTSSTAQWERWERRLDDRGVLAVDPRSPVAIKRDVHELEVDAPAQDFVEAFHAAMIDPARRFGLVRVVRKRARVGAPFRVGERFQGRFCVSAAAPARVARWLEHPVAEAALWTIESELASDFGEITELRLSLDPHDVRPQYRLRYRYLEGSYIAGSSTFIVEPAGERRARVTQVFEYQEIASRYVLWMGTSVVKMHNQVVYSQVAQAASIAGARVVRSDIPQEYLFPSS